MTMEHRTAETPASKQTWDAGLSNEVEFWTRYLSTKGAEWPEDFQRRMSPDAPLQDLAIRHLSHLPGSEFSILDIGSGPITNLGKLWNGKRVRITPVDALADEYDRILASLGMEPLVRTQKCEGENIASRFAPDSFDLVWSNNALDHSYDPRSVIEQAVTVVKKGCYVVLGHARNEAEHESYVGLHQWNFTITKEAFVIWNHRTRIDMTRWLEPWAEVRGILENNWVQVSIRKIADPPAGRTWP